MAHGVAPARTQVDPPTNYGGSTVLQRCSIVIHQALGWLCGLHEGSGTSSGWGPQSSLPGTGCGAGFATWRDCDWRWLNERWPKGVADVDVHVGPHDFFESDQPSRVRALLRSTKMLAVRGVSCTLAVFWESMRDSRVRPERTVRSSSAIRSNRRWTH